jgi:hypothetical protein
VNNPDQPQETREKDLFHQGVISKLFPSNNMGVVRTESGREIPFTYQLVILVGDIKSPLELHEGQRVGYDLGWTSDGLRVTKIKTYSPPGEESSNLEGKGGQGQDLPS